MRGIPKSDLDTAIAFPILPFRNGAVDLSALATEEKGAKIFSAVVDRFIELIREFRSRSRNKPVDHHQSQA